MAPTLISALERRKKSLRAFYERKDPGRIKNIDPLFEHFSFPAILDAVRRKYNGLPENWEYERFYDLVGHLSEKKIAVAMKKKGLDPEVVLGDNSGGAKSGVIGRRTQVESARKPTAVQRRPPPPRPTGKPLGAKKPSRVKLQRENNQKTSNTIIKEEDDDEDIDIDALFDLAPPPSRMPSTKVGHADFAVRDSSAGPRKVPSRPRMVSTSQPQAMEPQPPPPRMTAAAPIRQTSARQTSARQTSARPPPPPPSYNAPGSPLKDRSTNAGPMGRTTSAGQMPRTTSAASMRTTSAARMIVPPPSRGTSARATSSRATSARATSARGTNIPPPTPVRKPSMANLMKKTVAPPPAVVQKKAAPAPAAAASGVDLTKYRKMKKAGLPDGAIMNAMTRDGLDAALFDQLDASAGSPAPPNTVQSTPNIVAAIASVPSKQMEKAQSSPAVATTTARKSDGGKEEKISPELLVSKKPAQPAAAPTSPAKPIKRQKNPMANKFANMHNKLLQAYGMAPAEEKPAPAPREKTQVAKGFGAMHAMLNQQFGGAGGGGSAGKPAAKKVDTAKAKDVASKFANMTKKKELKVLPISDPAYDKYRKMQKMKLPEGAIRNCLEKDGFDSDAFFNPKEEAAPTPAPAAVTPAPAAVTPAPAPANPTPAPVAQVQQQPVQNNMAPNPSQLQMQPQQNTMVATPSQQQMPIQQGQMMHTTSQLQMMQQQPVAMQQQMYPQQQMMGGYYQQQAQPQQMYYPQEQYPQEQYPQQGYAPQYQNGSQSQYGQQYPSQQGYPQSQQHYGSQPGFYNHQGRPTQHQGRPSQIQGRPTGMGMQTGPVTGGQTNAHGWSVQWSEEYRRPYFFNEFTGQSLWEPPAEML